MECGGDKNRKLLHAGKQRSGFGKSLVHYTTHNTVYRSQMSPLLPTGSSELLLTCSAGTAGILLAHFECDRQQACPINVHDFPLKEPFNSVH